MVKQATRPKSSLLQAGQLERFGIDHNDEEMLDCSLCGNLHQLNEMAYGVQTYIVDKDDVGCFCPNCVEELSLGYTP
jgi:hypothetical protein